MASKKAKAPETELDRFKAHVISELRAWRRIGTYGYQDATECNFASPLMDISKNTGFWSGFISGISEAIKVVDRKYKVRPHGDMSKSVSDVLEPKR